MRYVFKGIHVESGDYIGIIPSHISTEVMCVVIAVQNGVLDVMSTELALMGHSGLFTEDKVASFRVIDSAEVAVRRESYDLFTKGQEVVMTFRSKKDCRVLRGKVIAAIEGIVVAVEESSKETMCTEVQHCRAVE